MTVLNINSSVEGKFLVERHVEGDELWTPRHPSDPRFGEPMVISFGKVFEDLFESKDDSVMLRADDEGNVELIFIHNGGVSDFLCVSPEDVPATVEAVKSTWS